MHDNRRIRSTIPTFVRVERCRARRVVASATGFIPLAVPLRTDRTTIGPVSTPSRPNDYPFEWETTAVLSDGSTASIRPIRPDDRAMLVAFHGRQSQESIYFRYFRFRPELSDTELDYFTNVDYDKRMAFVATVGDELVAVARYESGEQENRQPEVAFFVDDAHHGKGLATLMLEYLAAVARQKDLDGFTATVLAENYGMLRVFRRAGFDVSSRFSDGVIEVTLGIEVTRAAAQVIGARERRAHARSVARLLEPASVAIVGASRDQASVGHRLATAIADGGFTGSAWCVNPGAAAAGTSEIAGLPVVATIGDIGQPVDLAVIAVPAPMVEDVVAGCADSEVGGLLVVSAGFSDEGASGSELEARLAQMARSHGMRLIGPASFGILNAHPDVRLNATFLPLTVPASGAVAVLSQSGPLGAALLDQLSRSGVGLSSFVALGQRADVSTNDLLQYWAVDEATSAICLYQPTIGNPRNFSRIARDVSMVKPIIAVAPEAETMSDLLRQSGVVVVPRVSELIEQAEMAVDQPLPEGRRVAIISNTASLASLASAACRRAGLEVVVPPGVVDSVVADALLIGDADTLSLPRRAEADVYERVIAAAAVSADVDMTLIAIVPTLTLSIADLAGLLDRVNVAVAKPMAATGLVDAALLDVNELPAFTYPEQAAGALARMADYAEWRRRQGGLPIEADAAMVDHVDELVAGVLGDTEEQVLTMTTPGLAELLTDLDLPVARFGIASTADEAVEMADALGYPVVLKAGRVHDRRSGEAGGTALDLRSASQIRSTFARMLENFDDELLPAIVQGTAPTGVHLAVELEQSTTSGSRLALGIGGASATSISAMSSVFLPASEDDLDRLLAEPWLADLLPTASARYSLRDLLARLATAADASPDIASIRFNPVLASNTDTVPVEASMVLRRWPRDPLAGVRHLAG